MEPRIELAAQKSLDRMIGNICGYLAAAISLFLWAFYLFAPPGTLSFSTRIASWMIWLIAFSAVLPFYAGWKSSRLWFLLFLCPLMLFAVYEYFPKP